MLTQSRREGPALLAGDVFFLILALWVTLFVRYGTPPAETIFLQHLIPFLFLFFLSALVFFITGLYEKHTLLFKSKLPGTIFYAQIANCVVAALFFFFIPYFGIQPKTNLVIYLVLSTGFVSIWRLYLFPFLSAPAPVSAILVGEGSEAEEIVREVNGNPRYGLRIVETRAAKGDTRLEPGLFYLDAASLYEEIFDRVALSFLDQRWFLAEQVRAKRALYGFLKRILDIVVSVFGLLILSPLLLVVAGLLKLGPGGTAFIFQKRIGERGRVVRIIKFRTMLFDDENDPERQKQNRITRFGGFLRKSQIDEFPQFWNVLKGELSLIGPRPEIPTLVAAYEKAIPFYAARHLVPPGISGWAQIKHASPPKFKLDVERTRAKLSYDLYYLKHRSLVLDLSVVLRTVKILFSRMGQ
jgi:lipopolysaccharide/colanic/teichoic acid biosynthesis glycosyltransferase